MLWSAFSKSLVNGLVIIVVTFQWSVKCSAGCQLRESPGTWKEGHGKGESRGKTLSLGLSQSYRGSPHRAREGPCLRLARPSGSPVGRRELSESWEQSDYRIWGNYINALQIPSSTLVGNATSHGWLQGGATLLHSDDNIVLGAPAPVECLPSLHNPHPF